MSSQPLESLPHLAESRVLSLVEKRDDTFASSPQHLGAKRRLSNIEAAEIVAAVAVLLQLRPQPLTVLELLTELSQLGFELKATTRSGRARQLRSLLFSPAASSRGIAREEGYFPVAAGRGGRPARERWLWIAPPA